MCLRLRVAAVCAGTVSRACCVRQRDVGGAAGLARELWLCAAVVKLQLARGKTDGPMHTGLRDKQVTVMCSLMRDMPWAQCLRLARSRQRLCVLAVLVCVCVQLRWTHVLSEVDDRCALGLERASETCGCS